MQPTANPIGPFKCNPSTKIHVPWLTPTIKCLINKKQRIYRKAKRLQNLMIGNFLKIYNVKLDLVYVDNTGNILIILLLLIMELTKINFFSITLKGKDRIKQVLVY